MRSLKCPNCGSNDLYEENGYSFCRYCGAKLIPSAEDIGAKQSTISLNADVQRLLQKCKENPERAKKYAQLALEIDPNNTEALQYLKKRNDNNGGCYVATAVYGSYDCPQVWTLRRYRDYTLAGIWYGRAFIRTYYATSPTIVKWFGETEWFKNMWKPKLDKMVKELNEKGVANTPYQDRNW